MLQAKEPRPLPTPLLLETSLGSNQEAKWRAALVATMPDEAIVSGGDHAHVLRDVEIAIMANPLPGSLRYLPSLQWVQSLWAVIDALLWDAIVLVGRLVDPSLAKPLSVCSGIRFRYGESPAPMAELIIRNYCARALPKDPLVVLSVRQRDKRRASLEQEQTFSIQMRRSSGHRGQDSAAPPSPLQQSPNRPNLAA